MARIYFLTKGGSNYLLNENTSYIHKYVIQLMGMFLENIGEKRNMLSSLQYIFSPPHQKKIIKKNTGCWAGN